MNRPRRILHLCDNRDGVVEGVAALACALEGAWESRIALLGRTAQPEVLRESGLSWAELRGRGHFDPLLLGRLARSLRRERPAVIHAWGLTALMAAHLTRPRAPALPLTATLDLRDSLPSWSKRTLRALAPRLAALAAADEPTAAWLRSVIGETPPCAVATIPLPVVAWPRTTAARAVALARWQFDESTRLIVTAGRLEPQARFDEAIWSFELVRVLHPAARLAIVGDGPDRRRLERFARQVSEPGCVALVHDSRSELAEALTHAEVYWQLGPSAATPTALVHAMQAGKPIVASDAAVHLAIRGGDDAFAVVPQNSRAATGRATDDFFKLPEDAAKYGAMAKARAEQRFAPATAAASQSEIYAAALR